MAEQGSEAVLLYVTTANEEEAVKIARALVEERLVACVNMMAPVRSFFYWQDALEDAREVVFVAKTLRSSVAKVSERIKQLHSYDVPAIIALPIVDGDKAYLDWVAASCR